MNTKVKLLKDRVLEKIFRKIFEDPSKAHYVRELAVEAGVSPNSVINVVKKLEKEGLVTREVKKHIVEIKANVENYKFITQKRVFNLASIYSSGIVEFLVKEYNPKAIALFGSYSRGEDVKGSDIDIAVITDKTEVGDLAAFEKPLNKKVHISLVQYNKISDEFYTNLINGIVLFGYLDKK